MQIQHFQQAGLDLETGCLTDIGARADQEDTSCLTFSHGVLLASVCDGMGGYEAGEQASHAAVELLHEEFVRRQAATPVLYSDLLDDLDAQVYQLRDAAGKRLKAGTTIASVMIADRGLSWFSVGDSRVYLIRSGEAVQATRDHNYKEYLLDLLADRRISESTYKQEAENYAGLTSYLGMGGVRQYDLSSAPFPLQDGDQILLATDGVYNSLSMDTLTKACQGSMQDTMTWLEKQLCNRTDEQADNATLILICCHATKQGGNL